MFFSRQALDNAIGKTEFTLIASSIDEGTDGLILCLMTPAQLITIESRGNWVTSSSTCDLAASNLMCPEEE